MVVQLRDHCSDHKPVQHRDRLPPWCHSCGRTKDMADPEGNELVVDVETKVPAQPDHHVIFENHNSTEVVCSCGDHFKSDPDGTPCFWSATRWWANHYKDSLRS